MIKVKGISFRTVEIPDLNDRVYFGQVKTYTKEQLSQSADLNKAAQEGKVAIITDEELGALVPPPKPAPKKDQEELKQIVSKISSFEKKLEEVSSFKEKGGETQPKEEEKGLSELLQKIDRKFEDMQEMVNKQSTETVKAIESSATKMEKTLSGLSVAGPGVTSPARGIRDSENRELREEVYIPGNLAVTDMANHIHLQTTSVGQGDTVRNSLNRLKALRNKTQQKET